MAKKKEIFVLDTNVILHDSSCIYQSKTLDPYIQPLYDNLGVIQDQYAKSDKKHKRIVELLKEE